MPGRECDDETRFKPTHARSRSGRRTNACTGGRVLTPLDLPKPNLHGPRDAGRYPTETMRSLVADIALHFPSEPVPSASDAVMDTYMVEHLHRILGGRIWSTLKPLECRHC